MLDSGEGFYKVGVSTESKESEGGVGDEKVFL